MLVSVIIPTYNRENTILDCMSSVLAQSEYVGEIIITDNCSSDKTLNIVNKNYACDERVKILRSEENCGPVLNWYKGIYRASCKYSLILFSDDLLLEGSMSKLVSTLEKSRCEFVLGSALIGESKENSMHAYATFRNNENIKLKDYLWGVIKNDLPYSPCGMLFRTNNLKESLQENFEDEDDFGFLMHGAGPDLLIPINLLKHNANYCKKISLPVVFFRSHKGSLTVQNLSQKVTYGYVKTLLQQCSTYRFLYFYYIAFSFLLIYKKSSVMITPAYYASKFKISIIYLLIATLFVPFVFFNYFVRKFKK